MFVSWGTFAIVSDPEALRNCFFMLLPAIRELFFRPEDVFSPSISNKFTFRPIPLSDWHARGGEWSFKNSGSRKILVEF